MEGFHLTVWERGLLGVRHDGDELRIGLSAGNLALRAIPSALGGAFVVGSVLTSAWPALPVGIAWLSFGLGLIDRVVARPDAVEVRRWFGTRRAPWSQVQGFAVHERHPRFGRPSAWPVVVLVDGRRWPCPGMACSPGRGGASMGDPNAAEVAVELLERYRRVAT